MLANGCNAMTWLGTKKNEWSREEFPPGALNAKQLQCLFSFKNPHVHGVAYDADTALLKLSESGIIEIRVILAGSIEAGHAYIWMDNEGDVVASAHTIDYRAKEDTERRKVVSHFWKPGQLKRASDPESTEHKYGFWALSTHGAVPHVRALIRKHWVETITPEKAIEQAKEKLGATEIDYLSYGYKKSSRGGSE